MNIILRIIRWIYACGILAILGLFVAGQTVEVKQLAQLTGQGAVAVEGRASAGAVAETVSEISLLVQNVHFSAQVPTLRSPAIVGLQIVVGMVLIIVTLVAAMGLSPPVPK